MGQSESVNFGEVHGITLTVGWFVFGHAGIWALNFKQNPYSVYLHIFCMSCAAFFMILGPIMMIVQRGPQIITASVFHELWGFVQFCILPLIMISGAICKISKDRSNVSPQTVYFRNKAHSIFGWAYFILIQVPLLTGWYGTSILTNVLFGLIIFFDVKSFVTYLYLKFFKKRLETKSIGSLLIQKSLRQIKSYKGLKIYSQNYFIFANYVFSLTPTLQNHPGGWKIIQAIRTRQVDRFLYGVDPIQQYDVPKVSHSLQSISLSGPPIAVLRLPLTYPLSQLNRVRISSLHCHDRKMLIHTLYLAIGSQNKFQGYSHLSQIGQYYSLTINSKFTRLYTAVNFLQPQNIKLLEKISSNGFQIVKHHYSAKLQMSSFNQEPGIVTELNKFEAQTKMESVLPLLIKKYGDGKFTSLLFSPKQKINQIIISQPRGLGLSLDSITSKNIVLFAGGTGLYPFSDLIDLLFKSKLLKENHQLSATILESNPILKQNTFENFNFTFYIAVNELEELHPITLYQCNELNKASNTKFFMKIKGASLKAVQQKYPNINILNERFQKLIQKQLEIEQQSIFYICGPVRFTRALVNQLQYLFVPPSNYKIV